MKRTLSFVLALVLLIGLVPVQAFATEVDSETQYTEPTVVTEVDTSAANTSISSNPDLFVFAGQSNMMGAAVLEPEVNTFTEQAWEYKYMPKLRGAETGTFVPAQNSAGEWYYNDLNAAYGDYLNDLTYQSSLSNYSQNTYFCPAMSNGTKGFSAQSEANMYPSASLPPYFVTEYASYGHSSIYAHMAKGSVKIVHYDMVWTPERKYITYICPTQNGKECRVRDIKLNDEKYLKENMEHEFRIRTELYGQAQGSEYSSGTARSDGRNSTGAQGGAGDSDGADQRRGMDAANGNATQNGGAVSGFDRAENRFKDISGELRNGDEEGGRGAERGDGEGSGQDNERSHRTGWESERESFRSYRQKNSSGRGDMVSPSRNHLHSSNIDTALMGIRGIANVTEELFEDGEESEEEKREREARNTGTVAGALIGGAVGAVIELSKPKPTPTDDVDDGEEQGMGMTM